MPTGRPSPFVPGRHAPHRRHDTAAQSLERQEHAAEQGRQLHGLPQANTQLTEQTRNLAGQLKRLTRGIHDHVFASSSLYGTPLR